MSISISQFRAISLQGEGKLAVTPRNELQTKGTGWGRVVEWVRGKTVDGRESKAVENKQVKEAFISAIKQEYGDVMAERATHELGKHSSLKARTVQAVLKNAEANKTDFFKLHNVRSLEKQVQALVLKHGGLEAIYNMGQTEASLTRTYGVERPAYDPKVVGKFMDEMLSKLPEHKLRDPKYPVSLGDIQQHMGRAVIKNMWQKGEAGFGPEQIKQVLEIKDPRTRVQVGSNLMAIASLASHEVPSSREKITQATIKFFQTVCLNLDQPLAREIAINGASNGLLALDLEGVAEAYEESVGVGSKPADNIKFFCAAEKCYKLRGEEEGGRNVLSSITKSLENFVREQSPIVDNNQPLKHPPDVGKDRERLASIRNNAHKQEMGGENSISGQVGSFIKDLYKQSLEEFGVNLESQTFILYGSGSRDEMFPFSDLEFAVLTDKDSKETDPNLIKALEYFEMRITALGETPMGLEQDIPIREGFCFDPGGNAPSSIRSVGTFVGTAIEVARQIDPKSLIMAEVFSSAKCLIGGKDRCQKYNENVNSIFAEKITPRGPTKGQEYAINNLNDHLQKMEKQGNPITKRDLSNLKSINAKELSRFPVFLASSLCKYHGVSAEVTNTLDRLKVLFDKGVLNEGELKALEAAFNGFGKLRLLAEVHHQGQEHTIYKDQVNEALSLNGKEWQSMLEVLEPLRGIYEKVVQFVGNPSAVFKASS
ncbi:hypothetical protein GCM10023213_47580 [Prosthecobacter algae]|uniref:DUF294 domain-containing protein n=1 Tax=Prosthecobacter algae TaxID=1144682 RepID=A0ABP9PTP5_9BACT